MDQQPMAPTPNHSGKALAGMILGIVGLIAWFIPLFGAPITIVGVILSAMGMKSTSRGQAVAGLIMSIIGLVATLINGVLGAMIAVQGLQ